MNDYTANGSIAFFEKYIRIQEEKRRVRRSGNAVGLLYLGITLIAAFWLVITLFVLTKFGISRNDVLSAIRNPAVLQFVQTAVSLIMFAIPTVIFLRCIRTPVGQLISLKKPEKGTFFPLLLTGIGFCSFANIVNSICGQIFLSLGFPDTSTEQALPGGIFGFFLVFISTAVMPALIEEFAMRGAVMGYLRRYGDGFAIIVSAILFGLLHANFEQILFAFLVGLALAFITVKSGSLWTAVSVHFFNNLISVIMQLLSENLSNTAVNVIYLIFLAVTLVLTTIGLTLFSKRNENAFSLVGDSTSDVTTGKRCMWFFTSPLIIIGIIVTAIETIFLR